MTHVFDAALFVFGVCVAYLVVAGIRAAFRRRRRTAGMKDVVARAESALGEVYARRDQSRADVETADRFIHFGKTDE
jgi:hypothetical protein